MRPSRSGSGRYLSEPKPGFRAEPGDGPYSENDLREHVRGGGSLERNPGSRFHYMVDPAGETVLFVDGQAFALGPVLAFVAPLLCRYRTLTPTRLRGTEAALTPANCCWDLLNEGLVVIYEEAD